MSKLFSEFLMGLSLQILGSIERTESARWSSSLTVTSRSAAMRMQRI